VDDPAGVEEQALGKLSVTLNELCLGVGQDGKGRLSVARSGGDRRAAEGVGGSSEGKLSVARRGGDRLAAEGVGGKSGGGLG
jgi:hypothetical protein